jgi:hypothetical protein
MPAQPQVVLPTPERLRPAAKRAAIYQTALSLWTYVNDDSFQMHPLGLPGSLIRPQAEDLWGAQMFFWIEQDVALALYRVNEQAVKSQNLPADDQWVANLPVKQLVSLRISDYLSAGTADATGHTGSTAVLYRGGSGASPLAGNLRFGSAGMAFTGHSRTGDSENGYDVVHFALNLVVDARELPHVLSELSKQNFITPLQVQYRNVDVMAAREAGYLYGSGPVLNVDIVCEALFFRSIYGPMMPQAVKDILEGKIVAGPGIYAH